MKSIARKGPSVQAENENQALKLRQRYIETLHLAQDIAAIALRDEYVAPKSPFVRDLDSIANSANSDSLTLILNTGRSAATKAATSACHNISAISTLNEHQDGKRPATMAVYSLARTAIEGSAILLHLSEPDISLNTRLLRTAQLLIWSTQQQLTFARELDTKEHPEALKSTESYWKDLIQHLDACGIAMTGGDHRKKWDKLTRAGESIGKFEIVSLMKNVHPDARLGYRQLSGVAHHAPWMTELLHEETQRTEYGSYYRSNPADSDLIQTSATACRALLLAVASRTIYHGSSHDYIGEAHKVVSTTFTELIELCR